MPSPLDFRHFFRAATGGNADPYPYQRRLAEEENLPELLDVPTGLGKTAAAVLGWLWRRRFHSRVEIRHATPRRQVYCLPMRVLVEQTYDNARKWLANLGLLADQPGDERLANGWSAANAHDKRRIAVSLLMGGEEREELSDWALWPARDAILIGTQDMLLSRALNRGYAAGRARWPMEFGLLNNDCFWVFDEVQLMSNGLATSLQLQAWRDAWQRSSCASAHNSRSLRSIDTPLARSLWMSATIAPHWLEKAADWRPKFATVWARARADKSAFKAIDRVQSETVMALFNVTKRVEKGAVATYSPPASEHKEHREAAINSYITALAESVCSKRSSDGLTLVIVNTVERASRLYGAIKARLQAEDVRLIHSRFRPREREQWQSFLNPASSGRRLIVSTQVVEAGVDISANVLFTELAPWASLVQRFGRCARRPGESGEICWMDIPDELAAPYAAAELNAARSELKNLDDAGLRSLERLAECRTPDDLENLFQYEPLFVPQEKDLIELFDTTPDLTGADIDVSRFIREGDEHDVQVFWRAIASEVDPDEWTKKESRKHQPRREELCPVPCFTATVGFRAFVRQKKVRAWRWDFVDGHWRRVTEPDEEVYPGQIFLLSLDSGGYSADRGWTGDPNNREFAVVPANATGSEAERVLSPLAGDSDADDPLSSRDWRTIAQHTDDVVCESRGLSSLAGDEYGPLLELAARWHDWGKAYHAFAAKISNEKRALARNEAEARKRAAGALTLAQEALLSNDVLAKAPRDCWRTNRKRPGLRHELASALAMLELVRQARPDHEAFQPRPQGATSQPGSAIQGNGAEQQLIQLNAAEFNLVLYLVAAHHGKVRLSIRSSPLDNESRSDPCPADVRQARGVREGETLPACNLGAGVVTLPVKLSLEPMEMGVSEFFGPAWCDRVLALRDTLGVFRLAYLEALLIVADWRASAMEADAQ